MSGRYRRSAIVVNSGVLTTATKALYLGYNVNNGFGALTINGGSVAVGFYLGIGGAPKRQQR